MATTGRNGLIMSKDDPQNETVKSGPSRRPGVIRRLILRARRWIFLNIWCSHLYQPTSRLLHRFNLHYAPPSPMSPRYGKRNHWCQWCGLRGSTWTYDPEATLSLMDPKQVSPKDQIQITGEQ